MANELTELDLGEWSICIDPANEDSTIEIVKSKSGLAPVLKETDMSDANNELNDDGAGDAELEQFVDESLEEFNALPDDEKGDALAGLIAHNAILEGAVEDATEVVKSLRENSVPKEKYDEVVKTLTKAGEVIEKMKSAGHVSAEEGSGLLSEITKANGGAPLAPEAAARIEKIEKAQAEADRKEAIAKAKTYGFGKAEDVADLETRIRKSLGDKDADAFAGLVKQAGAVVKASGLTAPIGESAGADAGDPIAKAKGVIEEIKKANLSFTEQQAFAKAIEQNPGLYRELEAARAAAAPRAA